MECNGTRRVGVGGGKERRGKSDSRMKRFGMPLVSLRDVNCLS